MQIAIHRGGRRSFSSGQRGGRLHLPGRLPALPPGSVWAWTERPALLPGASEAVGAAGRRGAWGLANHVPVSSHLPLPASPGLTPRRHQTWRGTPSPQRKPPRQATAFRVRGVRGPARMGRGGREAPLFAPVPRPDRSDDGGTVAVGPPVDTCRSQEGGAAFYFDRGPETPKSVQ